MKRIIQLDIERHNTEDCYYKDYTTKLFYTEESLTDVELKELLESIYAKFKYYEDETNCSSTEINLVHMYKLLEELKVYPFKPDLTHTYELPEEEY